MDLDELDGDDAALTSEAVAVAGTMIDGGNTGDASAGAARPDSDGVRGGSGVAGWVCCNHLPTHAFIPSVHAPLIDATPHLTSSPQNNKQTTSTHFSQTNTHLLKRFLMFTREGLT